jgi:outer membrane protein TolC
MNSATSSQGKYFCSRDMVAPLVTLLGALILLTGCSRQTYRNWADRNASCLINSRQFDERWNIPNRAVEAHPASRMADLADPDCASTRPPDDQAAAAYMNRPYKFSGSNHWNRFGQSADVEFDHWWSHLPLNETGELQIDRDAAIEMALLHNRDYQSSYETLWLTALDLAENRYDFENRWFGGSGTDFNANGDGPFASRLLDRSHQLGFRRNLAGGGQFLTNLANSFVWELGGANSSSISTNLLFSLTQPLLRGAFRHVRLESLTQNERTLLYAVRDFVRFRRQFYLQITQQYLGLLTTLQSLENQRVNLESLELNLQEHEELSRRQLVAPIQVDQVFQDYQDGRLRVLAAERQLQDELDAFKFLLGLPPEVNIVVDTKFLEPFELSDPKLDEIQGQVDQLYLELVQYLPSRIEFEDETAEPPPKALIDSSFEKVRQLTKVTQELIPGIETELKTWRDNIASTPEADPENVEKRIELSQQKQIFDRLTLAIKELKDDFTADLKAVDEKEAQVEESTPEENWEALQALIGERLRDRLTTVFVIQNQIRLYLIELIPCDMETEYATRMAMESRLDLMNTRAQVTDAFRRVEVAADQLESDLSVTASANLGTDPLRDNPVRLDSSAASYQLSAQFDGPFDRFSERNNYRASQIAFQQARRNYMAVEDGIKNQIRAAVRELEINRLNFQISRQQLITATRQVEEARINLRQNISADSSATRDLLQALQGLLGAKNGLISSWISYETSRISLFVEMELLYLDEEGNWTNERYNPEPNDQTTGDGFSGNEAAPAPELPFEPESVAPPEPLDSGAN